MGNLKYNNLVIKNYDELLNSALEKAKGEFGLGREEFELLLTNSDIFDNLENKITDLILQQQDISYLENWLNIFQKNQRTIVQEHPLMFLYFFLFIHASNSLFNRLKTEMHDRKVPFSDIVRMTLFGNLCRTVDEVGILLSNGSTRTALAVYRTVYEHAVVGIFLMKKDDEALYQKFVDYAHKDVRKKADSLGKHFQALKFPSLENSHQQKIDTRTKELQGLYGDSFFNDYGWAKDHLDERPSFWAIEKAAEMERYRPFYIWASEFIHPSFQTLGDIQNEQGKMVLGKLTEQSLDKHSFVDPMQLTLNAFYSFIDYLLYEYSTDHQYPANILLFRKILDRLLDNFKTESN